MKRILILAFVIATFAIQTLVADVVDSTAQGFTVRTTVTVNVSSKQAYTAFVSNIARWWDPDHTDTGNASNLSIEAKPGGYFVEKLPSGGFVEHMRIVYSAPGKILRMSGGLGPLQELGATGAMTIAFAEKGAVTEVTMTFAAGGNMKQGLGSIAGLVDKVLATQITRYRDFVNSQKM